MRGLRMSTMRSKMLLTSSRTRTRTMARVRRAFAGVRTSSANIRTVTTTAPASWRRKLCSSLATTAIPFAAYLRLFPNFLKSSMGSKYTRLDEYVVLKPEHAPLVRERLVIVTEKVQRTVDHHQEEFRLSAPPDRLGLPLDLGKRDDDIAQFALPCRLQGLGQPLDIREREDVGDLVLAAVPAVQGPDGPIVGHAHREGAFQHTPRPLRGLRDQRGDRRPGDADGQCSDTGDFHTALGVIIACSGLKDKRTENRDRKTKDKRTEM